MGSTTVCVCSTCEQPETHKHAQNLTVSIGISTSSFPPCKCLNTWFYLSFMGRKICLGSCRLLNNTMNERSASSSLLWTSSFAYLTFVYSLVLFIEVLPCCAGWRRTRHASPQVYPDFTQAHAMDCVLNNSQSHA